MMAHVRCSGVEQGLSDCGFISGKQYSCGHGNDVGIICSMYNISDDKKLKHVLFDLQSKNENFDSLRKVFLTI